jgi:uncharacterized protein YcbX
LPRITSLHVYPLKSAAGLSVPTAMLTQSGFAYDREWMVIDTDANFLTQREAPKLALVQPRLSADALILAAPDREEVAVPFSGGTPIACTLFGETCQAWTTTPEASAWMSDYLGRPVSIVARDHDFLRKGGVQYPQRDERPTSFVDNYGVLLISEASLSDLNTRLTTPVAMNRFRPNIVVEDVPPYEEEDAHGFTSNGVAFDFVNVCTRCVMTNIDQTSAQVGREPFQTLSGYRYDDGYRGVRFGAYLALKTGVGAALKVGDELQLAPA